MSEIVLRRKPDRPVMTRELRRRKRLGVGEWIRIWAPAWLLFPGLATAGAVFPLDSEAHEITAVVLGSVLFVGAMIWFVMVCDGSEALRFRERKVHVLAARSRRMRPHAELEQTRLPELKHEYARYSVLVTRSGTDIQVAVVRHVWNGGPLLRWLSETSSNSYDVQDQTWGLKPIKRETVTNPTARKVMEAAQRMQEVAEALEEQSYQEALTRHRLDALALATQPPPASLESRARVAVGIENEDEDDLFDLGEVEMVPADENLETKGEWRA